MRLDKAIMERCQTRTKAQDAIKEGRVKVNGKTITKASTSVCETDTIEIEPAQQEYASRAGFKLASAIEAFDINLEGKTVLDIGASTGGFTDVCLQKGAKKVYALDVGHLQLAKALDEDGRVVKMEGCNARYLKKEWFADEIDFICMDVSFISAKTILDRVFAVLDVPELIILIKPQFECGPAALNSHGVLKNEKLRLKILQDMKAYGLQVYEQAAIIDSPLPGRSGNQEALLHLMKKRI